MSRIHDAMKQVRPEGLASLLAPSSSAVVPERPVDAGTEVTSAIEVLRPRPGELSKASWHPLLQELRNRCAQPGWKLSPAHSAFAEPYSVCAEQFRRLRSRLSQIREMERVRVVQMSSALPGEGKSFTALNLALAITQQDHRSVLLVDGDMRLPKLHTYLSAPGAPGLSEYLRESAGEFSIVQRDTDEELFFIPAGGFVANPTELLANGRFQALLERLAPAFDWIIVDSPPVLPVSDACILARACEGLLMVVRAGVTSCEHVETALKELQARRLLGVVLNRADEEAGSAAYSYYAEGGARREGPPGAPWRH